MLRYLIIACALVTTNFAYAEGKILALSGSTRKQSVNKQLLLEAVRMARQAGSEVVVIDLKDYPMPFYDADLEAQEGMPEKARELRKKMGESQMIYLSSPEYNGSLPAVLKNAIDWASRGTDGRPSKEAFKGKKFLLLSASPGLKGGSRGLVHLRAIIEDVGGTVISQQFSLPDAYNAFDDQGHLKSAKLQAQLRQLVQQSIR